MRVEKIPWRRARQPAPGFLPGESYGQRSLRAAVHGSAKSWTPLKGLSAHPRGRGVPPVLAAAPLFRAVARSRRVEGSALRAGGDAGTRAGHPGE